MNGSTNAFSSNTVVTQTATVSLTAGLNVPVTYTCPVIGYYLCTMYVEETSSETAGMVLGIGATNNTGWSENFTGGNYVRANTTRVVYMSIGTTIYFNIYTNIAVTSMNVEASVVRLA